MVFSLVVLLTLFLLSPITSSSTTSPTTEIGLRLHMRHVASERNLTRAQLLTRSAVRIKKHILNPGHLTVRPSDEFEYLLDLAVGTPPHPFSAILDTGSDLAWTQCNPCNNCIPQPDPFFDASSSSSFSVLSCSHNLCHARPHYAVPAFLCKNGYECQYGYGYGDGTVTGGLLGKETFTFGSSVRIPGLVFGCSKSSSGTLSNSSGIIGLGRGPWSLVSQLGVRKFSYCFTPYEEIENKSPLFFGFLAKLKGGKAKTTSLIHNPTIPTLYYLSLKGITVGKTRLPIPSSAFKLTKDGNGGTIIDSGAPFLRLTGVAYDQVAKAFVSQIKLPLVNGTDFIGFELCFRGPENATKPKMTFHFRDADWDLLDDAYVHYFDEYGLLCVIIFNSTDGVTGIGNIATQNVHVLYDLEKEKLSFMRAKCSQL